MTRDELLKTLYARQVFVRRYLSPGLHRTPPFSDDVVADLRVTDSLCETLLQLPTGQAITAEHVSAICAIIRAAGAQAPPD